MPGVCTRMRTQGARANRTQHPARPPQRHRPGHDDEAVKLLTHAVAGADKNRRPTPHLTREERGRTGERLACLVKRVRQAMMGRRWGCEHMLATCCAAGGAHRVHRRFASLPGPVAPRRLVRATHEVVNFALLFERERLPEEGRELHMGPGYPPPARTGSEEASPNFFAWSQVPGLGPISSPWMTRAESVWVGTVISWWRGLVAVLLEFDCVRLRRTSKRSSLSGWAWSAESAFYWLGISTRADVDLGVDLGADWAGRHGHGVNSAAGSVQVLWWCFSLSVPVCLLREPDWQRAPRAT
ncbi:hypothetical protein BCR34DRAFT_645790 [Clohesyomyces aquaticus]|uniref:Uncharacterized protein n=1 Tax=Clohesyomyces aquaticus TaxID=1231657 RepID=A0A1Y1ZWY3_9PLEO|nr:hypothetical protein BCR34DRAFT_645790 [Clohesyomyces aquaticus]